MDVKKTAGFSEFQGLASPELGLDSSRRAVA